MAARREMGAPTDQGSVTPPSGELARLRSLPVEVLAVSGLMGVGGLIFLVFTLLLVRPAFGLLTSGGDLWVLGLGLLSALILFAGLAVGMMLLAWRLTTADRVARGLAYVLLGAVVAAILVGGDFRFPLVLVLLGSLAAGALLAFSPRVDQFFRSNRKQGDEAVSVVIARTLIGWWGFALLVVGVSLLPLAGLDGGTALLGLLLVGLGTGAFVVSKAIARGEPRARILVTAGAALYAVLSLVNGQWQSAIVPVTVAIGLVVFLWVPSDAKDHFQVGASA